MKKLAVLFCIAILLIGIFATCGVIAAPKKIKIGVSFDAFDSPFWIANDKAIKDEAKKLGADLVEVVADGDLNKQQQQVESFIAQKVDAIICAPRDTKAIVASIKKANEANIPFIINNRKAADGANVAFSALTDNYALSKSLGKAFIDYSKKNNVKLNILEIIGDYRDENAVQRHKGFSDAIKEANLDSCKIISEVPCEWKAEVALSGTVNAFTAKPEINALFVPSDGMSPAVMAALKQQNRWIKRGEKGHVLFATLDGAKEGLDGIKDGYIDFQAVQDTIATGKACIDVAVKIAKGQKFDAKWFDPGYIVTPQNFDKLAPKTWGYTAM